MKAATCLIPPGFVVRSALCGLRLAIFVTLLDASTASATSYTWVPTAGGVWTTPSNWSPSGTPGAGDTVAIGAQTGNVTGVPTVSLSGLSVNGSCTLAAGTAGNTLTVTSAFLVSAGTLTMSGENVTLPSGATGTIDTTVAMGSGTTFNDAGTLVMGPSGVLSGAGGFTLASAATLEIGSATGIPGNITATGTKSYSTTANYTFNGTAAQVTSTTLPTTVNNLTINNSAGVTLSRAATVSATLTVTSGTFTVGAFALTVTGGTSVSGTLAITSATGAKSFGAVTVSSGGTWNNSANKAVSISGNLANSGTFTAGSGVYTLSGSGMTITGTISIPSLTVTGTYQNNGTLTVDTKLAGAGALTQGADATLNIGGTSPLTTLTATASPNWVNYNGAAAQTVEAVTYYTLILSGSGAKTMATGTAVSGDLNIAPTGTATAKVGAGLNLSVGTLTLGGVTQVPGTWGSTTATGATYHNNTYFAATTGYVTVTSGATMLVYTAVPSTGTAGTPFSVTVQSQDAYGNPADVSSATAITLSKATGGGSLSGTLTGTIPSGANSVTISTPVYSTADTMTLTATATAGMTGLTPVTSGNIVFSPGPASQLGFTTQPPANTTAGSNMVSFVVQVEDSYGNAVADNGVVITLTPSSGSIYSGATATTAASGAAIFSSTVIWTAETGIDFAASATSPSLSGTSGAFNITPECSAGETTKGYSVNYVSGTAYIGFTNQYGLGSVVGLRLTNCTMTAQPYGAGGMPLGSPLSLPDNNIGGSYVALPAGTTNVLCTATKNNGSLPANANAIVKNLCGTFALQLDPVSARLEIAGGGQTQLSLTNVPAAERFITVQNGAPGLIKLTLVVNGQSFVLSPLSAGSSRSLDVGPAMNPGNANTVVLLGEGAEGASATLAIADSPTGDATMAAESIALQIETSAQGLQLSWPIASAGCLLQSRSSLAPEDAWVNWPGAAESLNGRWVMPLPPGDPARFFRLYYQP